MLRIPRQVVYLFIALAVIVPLFAPFIIRPTPMAPVISLYNVIDSMPRSGRSSFPWTIHRISSPSCTR